MPATRLKQQGRSRRENQDYLRLGEEGGVNYATEKGKDEEADDEKGFLGFHERREQAR
jgi:hypothetical protein